MISGSHPRRAQATLVAVLVTLLGLFVTGAAVTFSFVSMDRARSTNLAERGRELINWVQTSVGQGLERTRGTAGLVEASLMVTESEFERYALKMGPGDGVTVIGYFPLDAGIPLEHSYRSDVSGRSAVADLDIDARVAEFRWRKQPRLEGRLDDDPNSVLIIGPVFGEPTEVIGLTYTIVDLSYIHRLRSFADLEVAFVDQPVPPPTARAADGWRATDYVAGSPWSFEIVDPSPDPAPRAAWLLGIFGLLGTALAVVGLRLRTTKRATEAALREMRHSNADKDRFMASVSHELRTPLTSVVGLSSVLGASWRDLGPEDVQSMIEDIHHEGRELSDLVEDLLTVGRDESGVLTYRVESVDLDAEVAGIVSRLARSSDLDVQVADGLGTVRADPLRTRQVIRNLLVNAIRHADEVVRIEPIDAEGFGGVAVVNDGSGIPMDQAPRLFEAYQAGLREGQPGSIGLGLYVSRRLARGMGGDLIYAPRDDLVVFELRLDAADRVVPPTQPAATSVKPTSTV